MATEVHPSSEDARKLGEFLRAHRERRRPEEVGLPDNGRRRTPGLRREEVAALSGVGLAWYTWLEQGRAIPSRQVLDAVSRTLGLSHAAIRHVLGLSGMANVTPLDPAVESDVINTARHLLDGWERSPAVLLNPSFDIVAWNTAYHAVWSSPSLLPADRRNYMWAVMGDPMLRNGIVDWDELARAVLAQFRAQVAQGGDDVRVCEVYRLLGEDFPEFDEWWNCQGVRDLASRIVTVRLPGDEQLKLSFSAFRPVEAPGHMIIVQTPVATPDRNLITRLIEQAPAALSRTGA